MLRLKFHNAGGVSNAKLTIINCQFLGKGSGHSVTEDGRNNAEECNADLCKTEPDEDLIVYLDLVLLCGPILAFSYQCLQSGMSVECGNSKGSKCLVGIWLKLLILVLRYLL